MNKDVIAIDQDTLGVQGLKVASQDGIEVWLKPLAGGDWAFCLLNRSTVDKEFDIHWQKFNIDDEISKRSTNFYNTTYVIKNLWTKKVEGSTKKDKKVSVPAQDVLLYRLSIAK